MTDSQTNTAPHAEDQTVTATVTLNDQREAYALLGTSDANLRRMRELTRAKLIARAKP